MGVGVRVSAQWYAESTGGCAAVQPPAGKGEKARIQKPKPTVRHWIILTNPHPANIIGITKPCLSLLIWQQLTRHWAGSPDSPYANPMPKPSSLPKSSIPHWPLLV